HMHSGIAMATHSRIRQRVKENRGWPVRHDFRIDRCTEIAGLKPRGAWNCVCGRRLVPCPPHRQDGIIEAFRHFGMLDDS
ncbi:MAG: hypothetical protein OXI66_16360, partial [Boseongicola sp.]|nr:hypothetical protein [Boseongicola sp.]